MYSYQVHLTTSSAAAVYDDGLVGPPSDGFLENAFHDVDFATCEN